jgi:hypothetical protein
MQKAPGIGVLLVILNALAIYIYRKRYYGIMHMQVK